MPLIWRTQQKIQAHEIIDAMKIHRISIVLCLAFATHTVATATELPAPVQAALQKAQIPSDALVLSVQEVGNRTPRLQWQATQNVKPASLAKLVTTTAALDLLGSAWSWATPVWLQGSAANGVLEGNLIIKGSGDPKLVIERMWLMLRRVQQLGVKEIRGDMVLDRSAFSSVDTNPADFDGEPNRPYNAAPNALLLNYKAVVFTFTPDPTRNVAIISSEPPLLGVRTDTQVPLLTGPCADWRGALKGDFADPTHLRFTGSYPSSCGEKTWALAYADPATYNERALAGLWREMGGKLTGRVRDGTAPTTPATFEMRSPPLAEVIRDINKFSNNVMAQQLFLTLGLTQRNSGTPEAAREVLRQWLTENHGQAAQDAIIENGSGLSRASRLSAQLLSQLLLSSWASGTMPELMSSLPVSGTDGTLRRSRAPAGRAHLKTGSLRDVNGIAGYVLGNSGRRYAVVAIVNHGNASAARPVLDAVVQWVGADQ
jgi:serine-type D-Ala-D-Ala carboxypeptidase/endopeptidase (penicillin-binding protein 4)